MNCVFCMIRDGQIPSTKIYEDDDVLAILDISQATKGHTLVFPKIHSINALSISELQFMRVMSKVHFLAGKIVDAMGASGCNIINNSNLIAGQTVMHFHVHIIPRYTEEEIKFTFPNNQDLYDLPTIADKIKTKLYENGQ